MKKGLNLTLEPKDFDYDDYMVNFELLYQNIYNVGIFCNEDLDLIKKRTKEAAHSSYLNSIFVKKNCLIYKIYVGTFNFTVIQERYIDNFL